MKTLGRHLIAEFYGCNSFTLNNVEKIAEEMRSAAIAIGATIVGETFHHFAPQGVSGSIVIAESHLSIHTWPENGYVSVDIYTCGGLDPKLGFQHLREGLDASSFRVQEIIRGLPEDIDSHAELTPADVQIITRMTEANEASAA